MPHPNSRRAKATKAKRQQARQQVPAEERRRITSQRLAQHEQALTEAMSDRRWRHHVHLIRTWTIGAVVVAALGAAAWWGLLRPDPEIAGVERVPDAGRGHVVDATFVSATPTSGDHTGQSSRCGVFFSPLEPDLAVHALEHGAVVFWFDGDMPELSEALVSATKRWDSHVIISPGTDLDAPIVATAWNRRMRFAEVGEGVTEFAATYRNRGPETAPCDPA